MDPQKLQEILKNSLIQVKDLVVEAVAKVISDEVEKNKSKKKPTIVLNEDTHNQV